MPEPISTGAAILGAGALSAGAGLIGSSQASRAQTSAANRATDAQRAMFERQVELQEPFRQAGLTAQNRLLTLLGLEGGTAGAPDYGRYARDFTMADYQADPGYGFRLSEGMKALERSAAARGGLLSGRPPGIGRVRSSRRMSGPTCRIRRRHRRPRRGPSSRHRRPWC